MTLTPEQEKAAEVVAEKQRLAAVEQARLDGQPRVRVAKVIASMQKQHLGDDRLHAIQQAVLELAQHVMPLLPPLEKAKPPAPPPAAAVPQRPPPFVNPAPTPTEHDPHAQ
jgi:hypothetical protein